MMFTVQQAQNTRMLKVNEARRKNFEAKRASITKRFNELINTRIEGIRLELSSVIEKIAMENHLSEARIRRILKD